MNMSIKAENLGEELREAALDNWGKPLDLSPWLDRYFEIKNEFFTAVASDRDVWSFSRMVYFMFPFGCGSIVSYMFKAPDEAERVKARNLWNQMEGHYLGGGDQWEEPCSLLLTYILFESPYDQDCSWWQQAKLDLVNIRFYSHVPNKVEIKEDVLWQIIQSDRKWKNKLDKHRYYRSKPAAALDLLINYGNWKAFELFYAICKKMFDQYHHIPQVADVHCQRVLDVRGYDEQRRNFLFSLGHSWEKICREIASYLYGDIVKNPQLTNHKIPDIVPDQDIAYDNGLVSHAPIIIECKKSLYFTEHRVTGEISYDQNLTALFYRAHCDELQFWVMDKDEEEAITSLDGIRYLFADDFLAMDLPGAIKDKIKRLLKKAKGKVTDEWREEHKKVFAIIDDIQFMQEHSKAE